MSTLQNPKLTLVATTISGLEEVLAEELRQLGAEDVRILKRAVSFQGTIALVYKTNLWCRTAFHILQLISTFPVRSQQDLYDHLHDLRWEDWMEADQTLAVHAVAHHAVFTHTQFTEQLSKDAIVDRFRTRFGRRPSVDLDAPFLRIHVHLAGETCQILIDSSGDSLHKRGYRQATGLAPLNEVLAAGMIYLSGWDRKIPFFDPMCGSGTLVIEASLIALNRPAGQFRKTFAFQNWPDYNPSEWKKMVSESLRSPVSPQLSLQGADFSEQMIRTARQNIIYAGLKNDITISKRDFRKSDPPFPSGIMVTNPPFGQRLPVPDLKFQYKQIGDVLKNRYTGWSVWILAQNKQALKFLGLKPSRKITVFNGPLECKFVNFEVFEGSRKNLIQSRNFE